jgi:F-type H+-transporting ATPase subunit gamma
MSKRSRVEAHRRSLLEIREIMKSMRSLAYIETRKLNRQLATQHQIVTDIEEVARDLMGFYRAPLTGPSAQVPVLLAIGSERGFCGELNQELARHIAGYRASGGQSEPVLLAVGQKLQALLAADARVEAEIAGANAAEEINAVLQNAASELLAMRQRRGPLLLSSVHAEVGGRIVETPLLPAFEQYRGLPPSFSHPPVLNLAPEDFLLDLTDHFLFAALHEILYASLLAENQRRVAHLEGAVQHLDTRTEELTRRSMSLRQEEIIEEIEVILLNAPDSARIGP